MSYWDYFPDWKGREPGKILSTVTDTAADCAFPPIPQGTV